MLFVSECHITDYFVLHCDDKNSTYEEMANPMSTRVGHVGQSVKS